MITEKDLAELFAKHKTGNELVDQKIWKAALDNWRFAQSLAGPGAVNSKDVAEACFRIAAQVQESR